MGSAKSLIIGSLYFTICCGQRYLNSTDIFVASNPFITSTNTYKNTDNRIIGGQGIDISYAPFQISLSVGNDLICGGSIVSAVWVLTAAHCLDYGTNLVIRAGSSFYKRKGIKRFVKYAVIHPSFNVYTLTHDIAMIRVTKAFKWSAKVMPVILAKPNFKTPVKLLATGWGLFKEFKSKDSNILRGAIVSIVSQAICKKKYKYIFPVPKQTICAATPGKDTCEGDSGGPLTKNGVQYGITSFGYRCALPRYPGVYTKVASHFSWIKNVRRIGRRKPKSLQ